MNVYNKYKREKQRNTDLIDEVGHDDVVAPYGKLGIDIILMKSQPFNQDS